MTSQRRIIVTGGAGFIGSNLVRQLVTRGHNVLNLDKLTYAGNLDSVSCVDGNDLYSFQRLDLADQIELREAIATFEPDRILHLAAESHVDRSIDGPGDFIRTNVIGTFNLLQATLDYWQKLNSADASQFRLVHVSTDEVFGSLGNTGYFSEKSPYCPRSPYSASKASSDHLARAWGHTYGLPVIVTNCSNNYGPYQFPEKLIPVVILSCLQGKEIPVYGDGTNVRDWLHVGDHCEALQIAMEKGEIGQTYLIGGNNELQNIQLVRSICSTLDEISPRPSGGKYSEQITFVDDRPGHDHRYAIDSSKLQDELGWRPSFDAETGIRNTVQWYLDNRDWWERILSGEYSMNRLGLASKSETRC